MRICFFGESFLTIGGGLGKYISILVRKIVDLEPGRHQITIVSNGSEPISDLEGVNSVSLCLETTSKWNYLRFAASSFFYFLRHRDFDLIHSASSYPFIAVLAQIFSRMTRRPLVHTACYNGYTDTLRRFGLKNLILTSPLPGDGLPGVRTRYIPPFINLGDGDGETYEFRREHDFIVGISGSITPRKGHGVFFEAIPAIVKKHPGVFLVLAVAPEAPYNKAGVKSMETLREFVARHGLEKNVLVLGQVDVAKFIRSIDVYIFPFLTTKASLDIPLSVLEALAGGAAVVGNRVGRVDQAVKDGYNGLLIEGSEIGRPQAYVDRVSRLFEDRELLARLRANARTSATEFDANAAVKQILEFYREVAGQ